MSRAVFTTEYPEKREKEKEGPFKKKTRRLSLVYRESPLGQETGLGCHGGLSRNEKSHKKAINTQLIIEEERSLNRERGKGRGRPMPSQDICRGRLGTRKVFSEEEGGEKGFPKKSDFRVSRRGAIRTQEEDVMHSDRDLTSLILIWQRERPVWGKYLKEDQRKGAP